MRTRLQIRSLRLQLFVTFMLIGLIVLSIGSYYVYTFMQTMIKEHNEQLLSQQFTQIDHNIHGLISDIDRLSKLFVQDEQTQQVLLNVTESQELELLLNKKKFHDLIEKFISNYSFIHSIYLTTESLGVIGGGARTTLVHSTEEWNDSFFQLDAYRLSKVMFPELIVEGGLTKSFFNPYMTGSQDGNLISMVRGVRAIYDPKVTASLIFNVDERHLASIYAADLDEDDGYMFITDASGKIISSNRQEIIGREDNHRPSDLNSRNGSYDDTDDEVPVQIVYHQLQDNGWYVKKAIPLSLYNSQSLTVQRTLAIVFLLSLFTMFIVSYLWIGKIYKPLRELSAKMKHMGQGELGVTVDEVPSNELGTVVRRFNEMSLGIVELIDKNNRMQEEKRELEIEALQYQINPHFLYNTLNMIRWMAAMVKADHIVNSIVALGNILRPAFANKETMCSLQDELEYLDSYMKIINSRFDNSVQFELEASEEELQCKVPRFILQPLVENALAAGENAEQFTIHIGIYAVCRDGDLLITVSDSGEGLEPDRLAALNRMLEQGEQTSERTNGYGIGLPNVNKRIRLNFGPEYGLKFVPRDRGVEVTVRLPAIGLQE